MTSYYHKSFNDFLKKESASGILLMIAALLAIIVANSPLNSLYHILLEIPVITGSITRLMAVYLCNSPDEIGSMRSARHDFIPLAMGVLYPLWGITLHPIFAGAAMVFSSLSVVLNALRLKRFKV